MTAYRRPDYTAQVLESLSRCQGVEKWLFLPHVEPGDDRVITMIKQFRACESRPVFNEARLGLNKNSQAAMREAYVHLSHFNVHIEDDTVLSPDYLQFMEWAAETYKDDDKIFSVGAYNELDSPPPESEWFDVKRRDWFTCWGWGTWRKNLNRILDGWSTKNPKSFAWHINHVTKMNLEAPPFGRGGKVQPAGGRLRL